MDISPYIAKLQHDLVSAAELGDEETRRVAAALSVAIEPSIRLVLLTAATELAKEIGVATQDRDVKIALDGDVVEVDVQSSAASAGSRDETQANTYSFEDVSGDISRVTLRMMEQIKTKAEEAANQNGVSLNSWVSQAVQGALRDQMRKNGMG
ncbi:uncharacterized protein (DUF1778 family) [Rhodococcus sp. 27YEA15]|uniref:toxin-antitoxin system HicB family antitoxin n=1 Tax=Rhodococcus sp. 27YEA15 TaxID=3156259 RepID=UPI003C7E9DB4